MKPGDQEIYKCYGCGEAVIVRMAEEGTVPTFCDCVKPLCDGLMHRDFNKTDAIGRQPTHELYLKQEALSDKLSIRIIEEATDATS